MPELPEVETTRLGVLPHVLGRTISQIQVRNSQLRWPVELPPTLIGQTITEVERRAKYLLFKLDQGSIILHLGMSGSLRIVSAATEPQKHDHVDILLGDGQLLRYNDPRRFGSIHWQTGPVLDHWLLANLGVEPLGNQFNGDYLKQIARTRKQAIKNFIMDGRVVVGVGNIYANESLFLAGIRPTVRANRVPLGAYQNLAAHIVNVLTEAIAMGGTTLRDFVGSNGEPGYFKQKLFVYGRAGEPCQRCDTLLKHVTIGQRASVYCPKCQRSQSFGKN